MSQIEALQPAHGAEMQEFKVKPAALTPMDMLSQALQSGASIEMMEKLLTLQERWEANSARKAFDEAFAIAKAEIEPIVKNRTGHNNQYADLSAIERSVSPILGKNGLCYRHRFTQGDKLTVTCILSHSSGHREETSIPAPPDKTGSKNDLQAIGSTLTYLQRYTLMLALGLSTTEDDNGASTSCETEVISDEQRKVLLALMDEVGADKRKFCEFYKIQAVPNLPARSYEAAVKTLKMKRPKNVSDKMGTE